MGSKLNQISLVLFLLITVATLLFYDSSVKWMYWGNRGVYMLCMFLLSLNLISSKKNTFENFIYITSTTCAFSLLMNSIFRIAGYKMTTIAFAFMFLGFLIIGLILKYYAGNGFNKNERIRKCT